MSKICLTDHDSKWISTGKALKILGFYLSPHTFRTKYLDMFPWVRTPGGHYRWLRASVEEAASMMRPTG